MKYILSLSCPDRPGIVHAVSGFLLELGANIVEAAQFDDATTGIFFMRIAFELDKDRYMDACHIQERFEPLVAQWGMRARIHDSKQKPKTFIMVSQHGHCLNDLLFRWRSGLLPIDLRGIVSNHRDFESLSSNYGLRFHHIPVTVSTKHQAERCLLDVFDTEGGELLVLARYMQVLSDDICTRLSEKAINIHHSFLPSFKGARPYQQAHERGVKLIGATAHYVTPELDEGPIIEQDVVRASHSMDAVALTALGRDVESAVLSRAVKWHVEHRVLLNGAKTVVFR